MNQEVFELIKKAYPDVETEEEAIEIITDDWTYEIDRNSLRWWDEIEVVTELLVDGEVYYIGWITATGSGDMSIEDRGFEFDPSTIKLYEPYERTITSFRPKQ